MNVKIQNGTPRTSGPSKCDSCRYALVVKGYNLEKSTVCRRVEQRVTFPVMECSEYEDKNSPSIYDMEKIAWKICSDKKGNQIGFLDPETYKDKRREGKIRKFDPADYESIDDL